MRIRSSFAGIILLILARSGLAQQKPDLIYKPAIDRPAYKAGAGPRVAIDAAHQNYHTLKGGYRPFAELLRRDGYRMQSFDQPFGEKSLKRVDVLVIANPLHTSNLKDWSLPTPSAFTKKEIAALRAWVQRGGSLFLIADHMPFPGAAGELAKAFGVTFSNGYAKAGHWKARQPNTFEVATGLKDSPATSGRNRKERVTRVATFGGSAFKPPKDATPVLVFGAGSVSHETKKAPGITPGAPRVKIDGWCQGALLKAGTGRVAVFSEAAMFSAQTYGGGKRKMGMNAPAAGQNHQLLLNIMHWLSRAKGIAE